MLSLKKAFVLIAAFAATLAIASPAVAADNYPDPVDVQIELNLSFSSAVGGTTLKIQATAMSGVHVPAGTMTVRAFGKKWQNSTYKVVTSVKTPVVSAAEVHTVTATFVPSNKAVAKAAATSAAAPTATTSTALRTVTTSKKVTLLPVGAADTNGISNLLPGTGGTNSWYLVAGLLLVVGGAAAVTVARRRSDTSS